ncbi:MAG: hypothetical protein HXS48_27465 [Theionarchaea archaeon]|nr:MAG: hypothetical protein AYK19_13165 [Theionarchaea archaeon DG-70-1]MBU7030701.1 hypothetical protein [Theionarchaea archaeon]
MWKNLLNADPVEWLLEGEPWVRYNTLTELLEMKEDTPEVEDAKKEMLDHPLVHTLIAEVKEWPSYPLKRHNDARHVLHKLAVLADFGITVHDPGVSDICERVLSYQSREGPFEIDTLIPTHFGGSGTPQIFAHLCIPKS